MASKALCIVVVYPEKELEDFVEAVEGCKAKVRRGHGSSPKDPPPPRRDVGTR
jgi:hypothetical protein